MSTEIERKFLVDPSKIPTNRQTVWIMQGFLSKDPVIRIRKSIMQIDNNKTGCACFLTIKGKGTLSRTEVEFVIGETEFSELWPLTKYKIDKTRYSFYTDRNYWVVDEFFGDLKGLWLAEIELDSEDSTFEKPDFILDEVTEDKRYQNIYLAEHGIPK